MEAQMREMMGFSNFATKPDAKKRKTAEDGAVAATSSNSIPLGGGGLPSRPLATQGGSSAPHRNDEHVAATSASPTADHAKNAFPSGVPVEIFDKLTWKELEAYRKGIKDKNGDLAYFLPSFIEDPWTKLEKSGSPTGTGS